MPQIRAVIGNTAGAWKTVGAGSHTIQLDWQNGANAALVLTVDGTAQYTVNGNTTATIENAPPRCGADSAATVQRDRQRLVRHVPVGQQLNRFRRPAAGVGRRDLSTITHQPLLSGGGDHDQ